MSRLPVLLVEDSPDDERLARRALRAIEGIELEVARDGKEAVEYLASPGRVPPQLVLLDLKLPKMGGLEVLKWVREREDALTMPVVVFSSSDEPSDRLECQRLHANSFIQKPVDFDSFLFTFRRTVEYWLTINVPPTRRSEGGLSMCA